MRYKEASTSDKQAIRAAKNVDKVGEAFEGRVPRNDGYCRSYGNLRFHQEAFRVVSHWCHLQPDIKRFNAITIEQSERFLLEKSSDVTDKTLSGYAVALEHHLKINCGYSDGPTLHRPPSEIPTILASRAYTHEAINFLRTLQTTRAELSTRICQEAGLRAHELLTLQKVSVDDRAPNQTRQWRDDRFIAGGREHWVRYTVKGKNGLVREVALSPQTAADLERVRHEKPVTVFDRGVKYKTHYDVMGGKSFSNSFSRLSQRQLGHSYGAHGIRHTYAQDRMKELSNRGVDYEISKEIVSQELGHFRPSITDFYLR